MLERSAARPMNHETNTQICRFLGLLDNNRRAKLAFSYKIVKTFSLFSLIFC